MEGKPSSLRSKFSQVLPTCQAVALDLREITLSTGSYGKASEQDRLDPSAALSRRVALWAENLLDIHVR